MADKPIHLFMGEEGAEDNLPIDTRASLSAFRVLARLRPFIQEELDVIKGADLKSTIEMKGNSTFPLNPNQNFRPTHEFVFDRSLWSIPQSQKLKRTPHYPDNEHEECIDQEEMYQIASRDEKGFSMIDNAFMGINNCVLTYGQTSSGKTYTMMGKYGEGADPKDRGLIPRVCDELFQKVKERREFEAAKEDPSKRWELNVSVTFVEIYLEKVRDLLDPKLRRQAVRGMAQEKGSHGREASDMKEALAAMKEARVRRDPATNFPFVEGIEHVKVNSWQDCERVLERGSAHRTTAITNVHDNSSRSHAIFTIALVQKRLKSEDRTGKHYEERFGRLNLVDLAGSERGGGTAYVNESAAINKSLMALRRVIDSLVDRQAKICERQVAELEGRPVPTGGLPHVPYMDSVLTQLLQDSIGGNAKTVMISNVTPYWIYYEETLRTLEWSHKAKDIINIVGVSEAGMVSGHLAGQLGNLKGDLGRAKGTVDSLKQELEIRQKKIESLTEKNKKAQARIEALKSTYANRLEAWAARVIQLALYLNAFRRLRTRRRRAVFEAESAASGATKELRAMEEQHEACVDSLLRHNIMMLRIQKKAAEINSTSDETIAGASGGKQREPEDLRKELVQKKADIKSKGDQLSKLQEEQEAADKLLEKYQEDRERNETRRENERLEAEEEAANKKAALVSEVLAEGGSVTDSALLTANVNMDGVDVPLFQKGSDGKWQQSKELEDLLKQIEEKKAEADGRKAETEKEKKENEDKKEKLKNEVAAENSAAAKLDSQIAGINKQIAEAKAKCC
eukprot:TRINITY_DN296_c0_g1_i7.p1 TRINITY_DN296_c0_g1~~TRINITY_DN296_c0_g1_i7.p1  ORF type:complete len:795 (+),score=377.04 TRINITY_DN296_c0_g1_i7:55-2439(+)